MTTAYDIPRSAPTGHPTAHRGAHAAFAPVAFIVGSNLAGVLGVLVSDTGTSPWFMALEKPSFMPPTWLFAPVWTLLYTLMGIAAWRVWRRWGWAGAPGALSAFGVQLALNALWTPVFFGLHDLGMGLVIIVALWLAIAVTIGTFRRKDRLAAWLLAPYLTWVSFATALNAAILMLNA